MVCTNLFSKSDVLDRFLTAYLKFTLFLKHQELFEEGLMTKKRLIKIETKMVQKETQVSLKGDPFRVSP